jgi:DNA-binding transcriptional regulator YiaG
VTREQAIGYLAGIIDGEGSVCGGSNRHVAIANTDRAIIDATVTACEAVGIEPRVNGPYQPRSRKKWSEFWVVVIRGPANLQLASELPLAATKKREALIELATFPCRRYTRTSEIPAEELRALYEGRRLTQGEVAAEMGVAKSTVERWMQKAGIPCRPRGPRCAR